MVLEKAILYIKPQKSVAFEKAFQEAQKIIMTAKGYIEHDMLKCVEEKGKYILLVKWETLEDHEIGFRTSDEYQQWRKILHHFYEPFPKVEHYISVI